MQHRLRALWSRAAGGRDRGARWGRRRSERGAALAEATIVLPILVTFLFGMLDMGSVYNDWISVRQGTREGARQAAVSTQPLPVSGTWAANGCVTTGIATSGDGYDLICYTKQRIGLTEANTRVSVYFTPQSLPASPYSAGQGVVICTQYKTGSISGILAQFLTGKILSTQIEIRIEQNSNTFTSSVQETAWTSWPASCSSP